jgi:hypothetical protein
VRVLDLLHQGGFADRATVIRSQPDPQDWHRDQDIVVWPTDTLSQAPGTEPGAPLAGPR